MSTRAGGRSVGDLGLAPKQTGPSYQTGAGEEFRKQYEAEKLKRAQSTRLFLTDAQKAKFEEAFALIDTNGNGLLERDEIAQVLKHISINVSNDEFEYMLKSVGHDDAIGMTIEEFIDMMSKAEQGFSKGEQAPTEGLGQLGSLLTRNISQVMKYKNKEAEALALRNQVAHKKTAINEDVLDRFLAGDTSTEICMRCHKNFNKKENSEGACKYHTENGVTQGSRTMNHLHEIIFPCCNGKQIGISPVYQEAEGCASGKHISADEAGVTPRPAASAT